MIDRLEDFWDCHVSKLIGKNKRANLEPIELIRGITRKAIAPSLAGERHEPLPNAYIFSLGSEDYSRLCSHRVIDELVTALKKQIILSNCFMDDKLYIDFVMDSEVPVGSYELKARFERRSIEGLDSGNCGDNIENHTIVLERPSSREPRFLNLPRIHQLATLVVLAGRTNNEALIIGERKIYLGRLDRNELIVNDYNVSRLHAWISYERHRHVLYDANSRNGTYVKGSRIQVKVLEDGDEIEIGRTRLRYEVA